MNKPLIGCVVFVLSAIGFAALTEGQSKEQPLILEARIANLEHKVSVLEKRIAKLETKPKRSRNPSMSANKKAWRELRKGMSTAQVRELLGEPMSDQRGPISTWWYYSSSRSSVYPSVGFETDSMTVFTWTEPEH
ncbi:MAG: outer membrane protein assembly factor BamE [Phycisphaerae bacterium]